MSTIFWVDCETTGLDSRRHFAFQISYIITHNGITRTRRTLSTRPDNHQDFQFDAGARRVHGFSDADIIAMPPETEVFPILIHDLQTYAAVPNNTNDAFANDINGKFTIAGYNINFDIRFLKALFFRNAAFFHNALFTNAAWDNSEKLGFDRYFHGMPCDVMQLAQSFRMAGKLNLPNLKLTTVCGHFGFPTEDAHNSLADITNTKRIFDTLIGLSPRPSPA
ncbi:MAG: 3'-5' exonuclease [Spirochaetaceae bacterium]|jgi:DNA polymerase-3 subunit epsilon|nr:3'-5' exonuclease [Spirochaetaceae bacterium]